MKNIISTFLLFLTINCLAQVPQGGNYNELILVRNEAKKTIVGYFSSNTGNGQISCIYEFKGSYKTLEDKTIKVTTFWPENDEKIDGILMCKGNNKFILKFNEPLDGDMACEGVSMEGTEFDLTKPKDWKEIIVVKSNKAFFYKEPLEKTKRKAYITQYDGVGVVQEKGEWLYVDFYGQKLTSGWVKKSDFFKTK